MVQVIQNYTLNASPQKRDEWHIRRDTNPIPLCGTKKNMDYGMGIVPLWQICPDCLNLANDLGVVLYSVPTKNEGEDYYPLNTQEIASLLSVARDLQIALQGNHLGVIDQLDDIQNRLFQGIPGMSLPRPKSGATHDRLVMVRSTYLVWLDGVKPGRGKVSRLDEIVLLFSRLLAK